VIWKILNFLNYSVSTETLFSMRRIEASPKSQQNIPSLAGTESKVSLADAIPDNWVEYSRQCEIISGGRLASFDPFDWQIDLGNKILSGQYSSIRILKSRQVGGSLLCSVVASHRALKKAGFQAILISLKQLTASNLGRRIKRLLKRFSVPLENDNVSLLNFGDSSLSFLPSTSDAGRSFDAVSMTILDECSFYAVSQILQALSPTGIWGGDDRVSVLMSTPGVKSSDYHEILCRDLPEPLETITEKIVSGMLPPYYCVESPRSPKVLTVFVHYRAIPIFADAEGEERYISVLLNDGLTEGQIEQETQLKFADSAGNQTLSYSKVNECCSLYHVSPLAMYRQQGYQIRCSIDPTGMGSDEACLLVTAINSTKLSIKVLYEKLIPLPDYEEYETFLELLGISRLNAEMIIEMNGVGLNCWQHFKKIAPIGRKLKIIDKTTSLENNIENVQFLKFIVDRNLIEISSDCTTLKSQLKTYDLVSHEGLNGSHDDSVASLLNALNPVDKNLWYRRVRGLPALGNGSTSLVSGNLKKFKL
jgi:hypothetical protein